MEHCAQFSSCTEVKQRSRKITGRVNSIPAQRSSRVKFSSGALRFKFASSRSHFSFRTLLCVSKKMEGLFLVCYFNRFLISRWFFCINIGVLNESPRWNSTPGRKKAVSGSFVSFGSSSPSENAKHLVWYQGKYFFPSSRTTAINWNLLSKIYNEAR